MSNTTVVLPNGHEFWMTMVIPAGEATGILVLVITSSISAFVVLCLLGSIALSAWNTRKSTDDNLFVRSHAVWYLISLLLCDLCQAVGSIMNARWYIDKAVRFEPFCVAQGVLKHIADVGIAVWAVVIACHTFWVLFLRWPLRRSVMVATLVFNWSFIGTIIMIGPAGLNMKLNGPFFAISGYWCWISDQYPVAHITLDYMFMFISVFTSFLLYVLIFMRLRGNILLRGSRIQFRLHHRSDMDNGLSADSHAISIAKQMLLYPIGYATIITPIAICRFTEWSGRNVSFTATIFSDVVYLFSGILNVALFVFTRRVLPRHSVITKRFRRAPSLTIEPVTMENQTLSSFMTEKMDEEAEDEKTFKLVESPDSEEQPAFPSVMRTALPMSASRASPWTPPVPPGLQSSDRAEFPASSAGPLLYPQSPLYTRDSPAKYQQTTPKTEPPF